MRKLREIVSKTSSASKSSIGVSEPLVESVGAGDVAIGESRKDAPYIMPPSHGDASDPFYDLPAGTLMPYIVPNSLAPINPQMVKPLQLHAGPANERLAHAVKAFLQEADIIYGARRRGREGCRSDIDEMGQSVILHDPPGELPDSDGYYGWSKTFCAKMKQRGTGNRTDSNYHRTSKYSNSDFSRSRSRSSSRSRSPSYRRERGGMRQRYSHSDSSSRSPFKPQRSSKERDLQGQPRARSASPRSRSRSYSPPDIAVPQHLQPSSERSFDTRSPRNDLPHTAYPPPAFLPEGILGPGQMPIPPPPPPSYSGPWVSLSNVVSRSPASCNISEDASRAVNNC